MHTAAHLHFFQHFKEFCRLKRKEGNRLFDKSRHKASQPKPHDSRDTGPPPRALVLLPECDQAAGIPSSPTWSSASLLQLPLPEALDPQECQALSTFDQGPWLVYFLKHSSTGEAAACGAGLPRAGLIPPATGTEEITELLLLESLFCGPARECRGRSRAQGERPRALGDTGGSGTRTHRGGLSPRELQVTLLRSTCAAQRGRPSRSGRTVLIPPSSCCRQVHTNKLPSRAAAANAALPSAPKRLFCRRPPPPRPFSLPSSYRAGFAPGAAQEPEGPGKSGISSSRPTGCQKRFAGGTCVIWGQKKGSW